MIFFIRFLRFFVALLLGVVAVALGLAGTYIIKWSRDLPDYRQLDTMSRKLGSETLVYARDYTPLGTLIPRIGEEAISRTIVRLDEISPLMIAALISNEDRRFFEHYGLDPYGLIRQIGKVAKGDRVQGGSTLTNQLVKNTLLREDYKGNERTPDRKVKEWILSAQIERSFTKEEILQLYLNTPYWGDGGPVELYGVYAAAQAYFRTIPKNLTLAQSAYLTVLIPRANRYLDYKTTRETYIKPLLARMVEDGWVTQAEADAAWREKLQPRGWRISYDNSGNVLTAKLVDRSEKELKSVVTSRAPHFVRQVEQELVQRFGREKVYGSGGLRVYTTLDPKVQSAVETASRNMPYAGRLGPLRQGLPPGTTLGAVIMDPYNAEVLGMVGQKLRTDKPMPAWNNAAQGQRQVGSTIKPLLYTTAISVGLTQAQREDDRLKSFPCGSCRGGLYTPQNYEGRTTGRSMTIREGLDRSLNLVTVRLADRIGLSSFFNKLTLLGIPPDANAGLAATLGAVEATPVKMAAAYSPFVNGGLYRTPRYIVRVTNTRGDVLYDISDDAMKPTRVWSPQVAYVGLDMIKGVVNDLEPQNGGLATQAKFGDWPVAGKTGTSNGPKDFWFVGTTPVYIGAVWVGKQLGGEMPTSYYSGFVCAHFWERMMSLAHAGKKPVQFAPPPPGIYFAPSPDPAHLKDIKVAMIDPRYRQPGADASNLASEAPHAPEYSEVNFDPGSDNPRTVLVNIDSSTGRLATEFTPPEQIVQRRVNIEDLPGYAPDASPQPLQDEPADPAALKLVRSQSSSGTSVPEQP